MIIESEEAFNYTPLLVLVACNAVLGESVKIVAQRQHKGARTAFTFGTILRDVLVRQCMLNAGAAHVREVTSIYSSRVAADGRDLQLESGSRRAVLRCQPYQLPPEKYEAWREINVNFDPRELLGG